MIDCAWKQALWPRIRAHSQQHATHGPAFSTLHQSFLAPIVTILIALFCSRPNHNQDERRISITEAAAGAELRARATNHASHTSTSSNSTTSHPVYAGVHDTMRHGLKNVLHEVSTGSHHPVQNRLENWEATQDNIKLTMQRNVHGLGAPAHTLMERKIVSYVSTE